MDLCSLFRSEHLSGGNGAGGVYSRIKNDKLPLSKRMAPFEMAHPQYAGKKCHYAP